MTDRGRSGSRRSQRKAAATEGLPRWTLIFGACCLGLGILFVMALVLIGVMGKPVPCDQRFLVGVLLGLLLAAGAGVLGTQAALKSDAPLVGDHPIVINLTGGVVVFLVVLFAFTKFVPDDCGGKPIVALLGADAERTGADGILVRVAFRTEGVLASQRLYLETGDEAPRRFWLPPAELDDPNAGSALLAVARPPSDRGCAQLRLDDMNGSELARSELVCFEIPPLS